jgi:nucleotide-binding universal stress UspA family protein
MVPIRTILFPTDSSECSDYAFGLVSSLARDHSANLIVLHVATPPQAVSFGELSRMLQQGSGYRHELEEKLRRFQIPDPKVHVDYWLEEGNPTTETLHAAAKNHFDLIVLGTHGRSGIGRVLSGSVAEHVVRKASCPVGTVKAPLLSTPDHRTRKASWAVRISKSASTKP